VVVAGNERIKKLCMDASRNSDVAALVLDECDCTIDDATEAGLTELVRRQPLSKPLLLLVTATLQLLRTKEGADLPKGTVAKRMLSAVGGPKGANAHKLGADPELFSVGLLVAKFGAATNEAALPLKIPWLADLLLKRGENSRTIVFAETNALVTKMKTELEAACAARHGGACPLKFVEVAKNPEKRASNEEKKKLKIALGQLRSKAAHVLVVTAGFARGVDVKGLDLVVLSDLTMKGGVPETST
jgi:superfamily II DNA/RNA helicase